ncbi:rhodanese-related sulfurtransferase [Ereboglobus sp. PH5-10]|uniref:rhodanese-like domain-containing protein n=1 Tax=Ereboglobus sp. PH5-10 TaxID=2940629 RepID=UPI0024060024|nr:rhodanese-like domain-containing protein [Ereboglobus sp. PH5-10]MDF9827078.1 rhodanese-related sulfurtransferase [Ereboglobus sp. PH5-10]
MKAFFANSASSTSGTRAVAPNDVQLTTSLLLDVRTPAEFDEAHIEGSILSPLSSLDAEIIARLAEGKDTCVLICRSGGRARKAAEKLAANGFEATCVLDGGVAAWESAGLPLVCGRRAISLERQARIVAGAMVFIGAVLGYFVNPAWFALPVFVGAGLIFAGVTDVCGMGILLARMPWNNR